MAYQSFFKEPSHHRWHWRPLDVRALCPLKPWSVVFGSRYLLSCCWRIVFISICRTLVLSIQKPHFNCRQPVYVDCCWLFNQEGYIHVTLLWTNYYCFSYCVSKLKETAYYHLCVGRVCCRCHLAFSSYFVTYCVLTSDILLSVCLSVTQIPFKAFLLSLFIVYQNVPKTVPKSSSLLYQSSTG